MPERRLIPYDPHRLPPEKADLQIDGVDSSFGRVNSRDGFVHFDRMMVVSGDRILFDKLKIDPSPGAFVMPVRVTPEGKAQFLIVNEWKDTMDSYTPNIIQGRTQDNEKPENAARRLVRDEGGHTVEDLVLIGRQVFDSAYMSKDQPYYLATVPYNQTRAELKLKKYEEIEILPWMSLEEIRRLGIKDGKTNLGIYLAQNVMRHHLL